MFHIAVSLGVCFWRSLHLQLDDQVRDETLHLLEGIFAWCSPKLEHDEKVPSMNSNAWEVRSVRVHNRREIHLQNPNRQFFYRSVVFTVWDLPRGQPEGNKHGKAIFTGAPGTSQKMPVVRQSHQKCRFVI